MNFKLESSRRSRTYLHLALSVVPCYNKIALIKVIYFSKIRKNSRYLNILIRLGVFEHEPLRKCMKVIWVSVDGVTIVACSHRNFEREAKTCRHLKYDQLEQQISLYSLKIEKMDRLIISDNYR